MNRRDFLRTAGGAAGATAAVGAAGAGSATAAEGGGDGGGEGEDGGGDEGAAQPDFGGYLDDAPYFDGNVEDMTGQDQPTVTVGNPDVNTSYSFTPAAIHVDNGATVVWEWTGEGGTHNVEHDDGEFESELTGEAGFTFEYTFEEDGVYNYFCDPHEDNGMLGSVVVGTDYPTAGGGTDISLDPENMGIHIQEHYVGIGVMLATVVSLLFTFFLLKYGESAHTKGGNN